MKKDIQGRMQEFAARSGTKIDAKHIDDVVLETYDKLLASHDFSQEPSAPDILEEAASLYRQRNAVYGDAYKKFGHLMVVHFPDGLTLNTVDDFNRFFIFATMQSKDLRYSNDFSNPHDDSILDNTTYNAILLELDRTAKAKK